MPYSLTRPSVNPPDSWKELWIRYSLFHILAKSLFLGFLGKGKLMQVWYEPRDFCQFFSSSYFLLSLFLLKYIVLLELGNLIIIALYSFRYYFGQSNSTISVVDYVILEKDKNIPIPDDGSPPESLNQKSSKLFSSRRSIFDPLNSGCRGCGTSFESSDMELRFELIFELKFEPDRVSVAEGMAFVVKFRSVAVTLRCNFSI